MGAAPFIGTRSLLSSVYMCQHSCNCFMLLRHWVVLALALAFASAGNNIAARIAMMAMTTNNSINVKAARLPAPADLFISIFNFGVIPATIVLMSYGC